MDPQNVPDAPFQMKRVRFITILEAEPDMTLALPIMRVREHHPFHLPAGVVLTSEVISQIRSHHVNCFAVEAPESRTLEQIGAALVGEDMRIDAVFARLDRRDPTAASLRAAVMEYRLCFS
ncbi:MAG: hypothetical protein JNM82_06830 [Rhodocyclaceae bacterium]|nr:hypothetical protein [Rhodocyclaceae bacterium]